MLDLKKIISFLIIISMLPYALTYAEDIQTTTASVLVDEAKVEIEFLKAIGIINEADMGKAYDPTQTITRAEFSYIVTKMSALAEGLDIPDSGTGFSDVPASHWAARYIYASSMNGIISKAGDGLFNPEQPILYEQAIKMIVCLLGYSMKAEMSGGYPTGYFMTAQEKGIGIKVNMGYELKKSDVAKLAFRALDTPILIRESFSNGQTDYASYKDRTLLTENLSINKAEGIVYDDGFTRLGGRSAISPRMVSFKSKDGVVSTYSKNEKLDATPFLGQNAIYFYESENDDNIIYLYANKNSSVLEIKSKDIQAYNNSLYTYLNEMENNETASLSPTHDLIYNGEAYLPLINSDMIPTDGSVKLIDNNNDELYDVAIVNDYMTICVDSITKETKYVRGLGGNNVSLDSDKVIIYKDGEQIGFDDIYKWDILSVAESRSIVGTDKVIKVFVSSKYVDGKMTERGSENNIFIDGTEYELSYNLQQDSTAIDLLDMGRSYSFYLDFNGKIAAVKEDIFSADDYVFMIKAAPKSSLSNIIDLKVFSKKGFEVLTSANNLRVNGIAIKSGSDLYTALGSADKIIIPELIRIKRNSEGQITIIDSAKPDLEPSEYELKLSKFSKPGEQAAYKDTNKLFAGVFAIADTTTVYTIPDDINEEEMFSYHRVSELANGKYGYSAYNIGDTGVAKAVVLSGTVKPEFENDDLVGVVQKKTTVLDEKGEERTKLYFMQNNEEKSYIIDKNASEVGERKIKDIDKGDTFRYFLNKVTQRITHVSIHLDYSNKEQQESQAQSNDPTKYSGDYGVLLRFVYGEVVSKNGMTIVVRVKDDKKQDQFYYFSLARSVITLCEDKGEDVKVSIGTVSDIRDSKSTGEMASMVLMRQRYGEVMDTVIYNAEY